MTATTSTTGSSLRDDLRLLVHSHFPLIAAETTEEDRLESLLCAIAGELRLPVFVWSMTTGLVRKGGAGAIYGTDDPGKCMLNIGLMHDDAIYLFKDGSRYLKDEVLVRLLRDASAKFKGARRSIVLCGASLQIPPELSDLVAQFHLGLPDQAALLAALHETLAEVSKQDGVSCPLDAAAQTRVVQALAGLTLEQARAILRKSVIGGACADGQLPFRVLDEKRQALGQDGILDFVKVDSSFADVAGLAGLRAWLTDRRAALTPEGQKFGLEPPRGVLITGVQGCGKSLCARAVAGEWSLQLARFDAGSLYDKYVGESEKRLRTMLEKATCMAPLVLWIDEIEKGFASGNSEADAGLSQRLLGTFLTWMQEPHGGVFLTATSNNISKLPPELLRKGRFDEIFFVDLPAAGERAAIFGLHLKKRGRDPKQFDCAALAAASEGFSGAEIEQAIVASLYAAFSRKASLSTQIIAEELARTVPLSVTRREDIAAIRDWARDRTVPAAGSGAHSGR
ncbi:MAG TPA: AAA family ATPase [Candidatus Solibacter sp.]|nr:AAA family ATPase [Candidatus Solibacter sp.]